MNSVRILFLLFLVVAFVAGGYVYTFVDMKRQIERMGGIIDDSTKNDSNIDDSNEDQGNTVTGNASATSASAESECPDILIQRGKLVYLHNTKKPEKVGENPILFNNLDEYIAYRDKSESSCPILFLQSGYNTQGQEIYNANPESQFKGTPLGNLPLTASVGQQQIQTSAIEVEDASRDNGYNQNMYAGFDPKNMYVGKYTVIDQIHDSTKTNAGTASENPMDPNWGGTGITQTAVDSGKYDENLVVPQSYTTPKGGQFMPIPNSNIPQYPSNSVIPTISGRTGRVVGGPV